MEYTTNLNLKKPATTDNVLISDINENMDAVDSNVKALQDDIAAVTETATELEAALNIQSGTWTPQFGDGVGGSDASGHWYKIGKLVYVHGHIALSTASTVESRALITGFPFKNTQKAFLGLTSCTFVVGSTGTSLVGVEVIENSKQASFVYLALGRLWGSTKYSEIGTGFIDFSGVYLTDE